MEDWSRLSPPSELVELKKNFLNPERGFYTGWSWNSTRSRGYTLASLKVDISEDVNDYLAGIFSAAKNDGIKLILEIKGSEDLDKHLKQLEKVRPVLQQNKDLIFLWKSDFLDRVPTKLNWRALLRNTAQKKLVINLMYQLLPETAIVVETPATKEIIFRSIFSKNEFPPDQTRYGDINPWQRDSEEKTGHHDPCFLTKREKDLKNYLFRDSRGVLTGGVACEDNEVGCKIAPSELKWRHFTYLNPAENEEWWQEDGCYKNIQAYLGYRFVLREFQHSLHSSEENTITISMSIENVGYAPPFNKRPVYLVLTKKGTRRDILISRAEPRIWEGGKEYTTEERLLIPNTTPEGVYTVSLWLPDPSPRLRDDPRYAIRLANEDVWDEATGLNVITGGFVVGRKPDIKDNDGTD